MAEIGNKAAAALKNGGAKAKNGAAKLYAIAKDPAVQARIKGLADDGKKIYTAVTSPEAKRAYRQAAEIIKKTRKK
ncbi:hypothetical protein [Arthrobacter sp. ISL-72]|uniref:hypothetical protein n=1 Tax=Arthrobacter sp. ISL-72 TaxID=2819114 RepID=UPI001BEB61BF|nr:hypothetical protein [Arthrobacter sp. ISL-72]MBT2596215.1 hypothetical protein [Arthrobacter sp. ISL-72]